MLLEHLWKLNNGCEQSYVAITMTMWKYALSNGVFVLTVFVVPIEMSRWCYLCSTPIIYYIHANYTNSSLTWHETMNSRGTHEAQTYYPCEQPCKRKLSCCRRYLPIQFIEMGEGGTWKWWYSAWIHFYFTLILTDVLSPHNLVGKTTMLVTTNKIRMININVMKHQM